MSTKKVLAILGHPTNESFCGQLLSSYAKGAESNGHEIQTLRVSELDFAFSMQKGNREGGGLEPDLKQAQELISWADHVLVVYPTWWGSLPALFKAFIDRVFVPGFAFKYKEGSPFQEKLLKGKSMRVLVTMDAPKWWFYLAYRAAAYRMLRQLVFEFVGFKPVRFTTFGNMRIRNQSAREKLLESAFTLGTKAI